MRRLVHGWLALALLCPSLAMADISLNFVHADISAVVRAVGIATGKTLVVDPRVQGSIDLVSPHPVSDAEALKTLQASLRMRGFTLLQDHGILKVVPENEAKLQGVPTYIGNRSGAGGDQMITQVFHLEHESATSVLPILRPLISPNNGLAAYAGNNSIIVTDYADNVARLAQIIGGIDAQAGQQLLVIPLRNAVAADLVPTLAHMLDPSDIGDVDPTLKVSVAADARSNSVILRASSAARLAAAAALARQLDGGDAGSGDMHVVRLQNADAAHIAKILRGMLGESGGASSGLASGFNQSRSPGLSSSGSSLQGGSYAGASSGSTLSGSSSGSGSTASGVDTGESQASSAIMGTSENGAEDESDSAGQVQADVATNAVIITAPEPVYRQLRNVIAQLDIPRPQIYLEAVIVELSSNRAADLGVQWQGAALSSSRNNGLYAGSNFSDNGSQSIVDLTSTMAALGKSGGLSSSESSLLNEGLNIGLLHQFGSVFGVGGLLQALSTTTDANILSTPNLITLDNAPAKIVVGETVPVVTGSYATPTANTSTSVSAFNTYSREDVGISLTVKPRILQDGVLQLQIYQEDSSVDATTVDNPGGVTINKRAIQSTVLASDGQIIVLGGLMQDKYSAGNSKIPLLGDIPGLGRLFRSESKSRAKTNLLVFLHPVIIRDAAAARRVALERYRYARMLQLNDHSPNKTIRDARVPLLPLPPPASGRALPMDVMPAAADRHS